MKEPDCACAFYSDDVTPRLVFCPLHEAAPDLLAALKEVLPYISNGLVKRGAELVIAKATPDYSDTYIDVDGTERRIRDDYGPVYKATGTETTDG